ncbi:MAG: helix-turn-helix domain-containing protein [Phaeovulum sp.]|uniref:helix-turn-helix domain-containing protein n=1 Tax=Phaeovulum sp. TaxID=2934796 RepID=UPI00272FB661|nr:helix-turn-helix domain-containing protein [Phaeovulum sp.]MDP2062059.1 helix-turn-helix domain-containing protein [Phaeovulum sp.]
MSHFATNWAIRQRGLKPTTKIVLWHLSDRHNPDFGCFPAQDRLAHDCEISRAALNSHLTLLEARGLLRRERRIDPGTRRQMSTRYILAFEDDFGLGQEGAAGAGPCPDSGHGPDGEEIHDSSALDRVGGEKPCPESRHGPVSGFLAGPCPENCQSRVQNLDTNLVREPLREPVKEEEGAQARDAVSEEFFGALLNVLGFAPRQELPAWWQGWPPKEHVRRWRDELGLSEDRIIEAAEVSRNAHPKPPDGPKALDRVMERAAQFDALAAAQSSGQKPRRVRKRDDAPRPGPDELAAFFADLVNSDRFLPANTISNAMRDAMLARGLVTPERLRMRGVR